MVLAERQTAGRGRAGRSWESPVGNFYASALLHPGVPAGQGGWFALLAGLSLIEALAPALPDPAALMLKWPNDIMAGPAKLAGILLDATIETGAITTLIVGFGANLATAPVVPGRQTTSIAALGGMTTPEILAPTLCQRLDHWLAVLADDRAALRAAWMRSAHPPGTRLSVDGGRVSGLYQGIDAEGGLLLRDGGTVTVLRGGDVALV